MTSSSTSNGWHERPGPAVTGRLWPLIAIPLVLCALGLGIARFDVFHSYREYVGRETVPETLTRSGRTGKELRLLDYRPIDGVRLEGFDNTPPPEAMPSTVILEPEVVRSGLPIISVVVDSQDLLDRDTGLITNYEKRGRGWERPAYASYFRYGELVWATGAGLRVHGGKSRAMTDKSFRLHFRELYGLTSLQRDLVFGGTGTPIGSLVIHNDRRTRHSDDGNVDWHYTNPIAYEIAERIGCITVATQPVSFYLNGVYQGPYVLKERITTDFLMARFGHDDFFLSDTKSDDDTSPLIQGSERELRELIEWPAQAPAPLSMAEVERKVDLANLTNWFISILYAGTTDPFQGAVARDRTDPDGRWFWINWDMDHSFMDLYSQVPNPWEVDNFTGVSAIIGNERPRPLLFDRLRTESPEYRAYFLARLTEVLNHELTPEFMEALIQRYEATAAAFGIEDRAYLQTLRDYAAHRPAVLRAQMERYFASGPSYKLTVDPADSVHLKVNSRDVNKRYQGWYFANTPVEIEIVDGTAPPKVTWSLNGRKLQSREGPLEIILSSDTVVGIVPSN
jgi:hypothetical protein